MRQILKRIVETLVVIFGNCIYAFGIAMFILPSGLITGGTTGIALFVNDVFHTPVTVFVFVFNTIMFLIGFFAFGWKFAANTIVSTFSYPIALELITRLLGVSLPCVGLFTTSFTYRASFGVNALCVVPFVFFVTLYTSSKLFPSWLTRMV